MKELLQKIRSINFKQRKYIFPAVVYVILIFLGCIIIRFFNIKPIDLDGMLKTTEYYNDKLPDANLKGDGIGDKYTNMLDNYGKIKDETAVENIDRDTEDKKEEYTSQYNDAEIAAMNEGSAEAKETERRLQELQRQIREQQEKEHSHTGRGNTANTSEEEETLESLRKALAEARGESQSLENGKGNTSDGGSDANGESGGNASDKGKEADGHVTENEQSVNALSEDAPAEEVVKKHLVASDYFNTIATNEPEHRLIRAIVDEEVKAVDGSRVRLRLLDDIDIGERTISKGCYLYCTMSGFGQQRVKGSVKSVLVGDELVKVSLSIYDTDGMEGLYVPKSSFSETGKDIASGAISQNMSVNDGSSTSSLSRWGMQALQNAYQKTANALSKNIRKNKVKVKYGTQVYLINSKERAKK